MAPGSLNLLLALELVTHEVRSPEPRGLRAKLAVSLLELPFSKAS